jgi:hypothetical protein
MMPQVQKSNIAHFSSIGGKTSDLFAEVEIHNWVGFGLGLKQKIFEVIGQHYDYSY